MPKVSFNINYEELLTIHGKKSRFNQYYHLDSPFSFVLETYNNTEGNEYINIVSFTPNDIKHTIIKDSERIAASKNRCLHQHDYYELMFVLNGSVTNFIENIQHTYTKGSGCILNRNLRHAEKFEGNFRVFFLNLSKDYIKKINDTSSGIYFKEELLELNNTIFKFWENNETEKYANVKEYLDLFPVRGNSYGYDKIYELGENIAKTMLSPHYGSSHLINGYISSLFSVLSDPNAYHVTNMKLDYGNDFLIFATASHIIEDTYGMVSRAELSKQLLYSGDYINRIIKKYSGMNLSGYCMNFRMNRALELIKTSDLSITEIAYELGFKNRNHFYLHFKKKFHAMPSSFRKRETSIISEGPLKSLPSFPGV